ncbi:MAG: hypothetical protein SGJ20_09810 [Planctomycetota bacterium]|nr:hypothetical protein [Planctomycetota bacterium]
MPNHASKSQHSAAEQIREKGAELKENLQNMGAAAKDAAQRKLEGVSESLSGYYEQGRECAADFEQSLETKIRERPIGAILVAAGVGFLVGMCWTRK